jgi:hypothetical protein
MRAVRTRDRAVGDGQGRATLQAEGRQIDHLYHKNGIRRHILLAIRSAPVRILALLNITSPPTSP